MLNRRRSIAWRSWSSEDTIAINEHENAVRGISRGIEDLFVKESVTFLQEAFGYDASRDFQNARAMMVPTVAQGASRERIEGVQRLQGQIEYLKGKADALAKL